MNTTSRKFARLAAAMLVLFAGTQAGLGQNITSGTLSGTVVDAQKGVLPGATITATHVPTGSVYEAITQADGRFTMVSVRVGGPYTIKATMSGFKEETKTGIEVGLGEARSVDFTLALATVTETVNVVAEAQVIDTSRAGTAANITADALATLPTISRSLTDMVRTSPHFNETNSNGGDSFVSVAGRNNRYNNIQIDGAVNNDLFGLAASNTPGGQTGTQPISLDAIQEVQMVVAPYDVRQGGFSGGGVNAITRSGANKFSGTAYWFQRNQSLVGQIPAVTDSTVQTKVGLFADKQGGGSLGGPIVKDHAFFFTNVDLGRKTTPNGYSVNGTSGQPWGHQAEVQRAVDILKNQYGYDTGSLDEFSKRGNSDKIFVRADFNLKGNNRLTVRHNYVKGLADQSGTTPSTIIYVMPANFYMIQDTMNSTVAQLNSSWGKAYNELRVTYARERNFRDPGTPFPFLQIDLSDGSNIRSGAENSSHQNRLDQDVVEITDDVTWIKGTHTLTIGTHNELFKFYNLFIQNYYGNYRFASVDKLSAAIAGSFLHNFSAHPDNPEWAAEFSVRQFGVYAGDQWRAKQNLTLTYGIRFDTPQFPDVPTANPVAINSFGYATDIAPAPKMWSPRVGFNWNLSQGEKRRQLRGGIGLFSGRTPYVWLSNQYGNTGVDLVNLSTGSYSATKSIPFVSDPLNQPTSLTGAGAASQTINVVDPNYQFPSIIRGNLAFDHQLPFFGLVGSAEVLFSDNVNEIKYENLNRIQTSTATVTDARPVFTQKLTTVNDTVLLTNTGEGYSWSVSYKVEKPFRNGFYWSASYLYGDSYSVIDGTSSVAYSNWAGLYTDGDPSNPALRRSDFSPGHRVNMTATIPIPLFKGLRSSASFYYNGQSGRPYSLVFNSDVNNDGRTTNDLLFVPATADQVNVTNGTWAQLDAFLANDPWASQYRGKIGERNGARAPWSNILNFRYAVTVPTGGKTKVEATFDVSNLLNLLNDDWGWVYYPNFGGPTIIAGSPSGGTALSAPAKYTYNLATITAPTFRTFTRDDLRSRWQMQWGVRFRF